jgi:hypothetical protein
MQRATLSPSSKAQFYCSIHETEHAAEEFHAMCSLPQLPANSACMHFYIFTPTRHFESKLPTSGLRIHALSPRPGSRSLVHIHVDALVKHQVACTQASQPSKMYSLTRVAAAVWDNVVFGER